MESSTKVNQGLQGIFLVALVINLLMQGAGSLEYAMGMINSLQMILHLPMLYIFVPPNVARFFQVILPIVMFDILSAFEDQIKEFYAYLNLEFSNEKDLGFKPFD